MAGKLFILRQVADFAPGFLENTVLEDGCLQLSHRGNAYQSSGIYTSPAFTAERFFSLLPSWNADTPLGTSVEMQARVAADGRWSQWFSFGRWSPFVERASLPPQQDEIAQVKGEHLTIVDGGSAADMVQMRVQLATEDEALTPKVFLLALATDATQQMGHEPPAYNRQLPLPAYSTQVRDPSIGEHIPSATSLCMLMNRYGSDLLPEEVARIVYDWGAGQYGNLAFLCAAVGCYGFTSHIAYTGLSSLRHEVWQGRVVAARVHYRAPALSGEEEADTGAPLPPVLEGSTRDSTGHFVAVCGFIRQDGTEQVVLHDPLAPGDDEVQRIIPLAVFAKIYTGIALFIQKGPRGAGRGAPKRKLARLVIHDNLLRLFDGEEELVPARLLDGSLAPATMCYTLSDGTAYASAAQNRFYYPIPDEHGAVRFERAAADGRRIIFYLFGPRGEAFVAEKPLDAPE